MANFDWINNSHLEDKSKRTHEEKHFFHPDGGAKMICIKSSGLLHAKTDKGFQDIRTELPNFNFPEGKEINKEEEKHYMLDLPEWGDIRVDDDKKVVRVYDLDGKSIYKYHSPLVTVKGELPYSIYDSNNVKIKDGLAKDLEFYQKLVKKDTAESADFEVVDKKLYFKLSPKTKLKVKDKYTLQAWDDTDTTSTNSGDSDCREGSPTVNRSTAVEFATGYHTSGTNLKMRGFIQWTLPSGSGTISDVVMWLYNTVGTQTLAQVNMHQLTRTFVESQVTWNVYSTGNNWTTAGGDYGATIVDSNTGNTNFTWYSFGVMGSAATNPITLTWSDTVGFLLKAATESGNNYNDWASKEATNTSLRPYLEITYSTVVANTTNFFQFF